MHTDIESDSYIRLDPYPGHGTPGPGNATVAETPSLEAVLEIIARHCPVEAEMLRRQFLLLKLAPRATRPPGDRGGAPRDAAYDKAAVQAAITKQKHDWKSWRQICYDIADADFKGRSRDTVYRRVLARVRLRDVTPC